MDHLSMLSSLQVKGRSRGEMNAAFCTPAILSFSNVQLHFGPRRLSFVSVAKASLQDETVSSVASAAALRGFRLQDDSLGPLLNMSLYRAGSEGIYAGSISGAVLLKNRLHIEAYKAAPRDRRGGLLDVSPGMILFIAALAFGKQKGARHVYGLAINDAEDQHHRLVRYLKRFGGSEVQDVTESFSDVPARIFYGGLGVIIRGDIEEMLRRGRGMLERTTPAMPNL